MATAVGPLLSQLLARYGLESLAPWLAEQIIKDTSEEQIQLELYDRPEFKARFPAIAAREKAGLPPVSIEEYLAYEGQMSQMARAYGVGLDKAKVDALISNNVSAAEAEDRIGIAARAVYQTDPTTRAELSRLYGIETGDLINYWLNPREQMPVLQRKFVTGQIAGEAQRVGYGQQLTAAQAGYLFDQGVTGENAGEAFGKLVQAESLFEATDRTETDLGVDEQLALVAGDQRVGQEVERRAGKRVAAFEGGGTFAAGKSGLAGLGSAARP